MSSTESPADYPYAHLLPTFDHSLSIPLFTPFKHIDPAQRALVHLNPRSFLDGAKVIHLTPGFGSEVHDLNLAHLDDNGRDQLALEVLLRFFFVKLSFYSLSFR